MSTKRLSFLDFLFFAAILAAVPVGFYHFSIGLYAQAAMALGAAAMGTGVALGWNPLAATAIDGAIQPISAVPAPLVPVSLWVTETRDPCLLGYRPGASWMVDQYGHLSRPLCRAAAAAVTSVLRASEPGMQEQRFTCQCPLASRQVSVAVKAA